MRNIVPLLILSVLCSSCNIYKSYKTPDLKGVTDSLYVDFNLSQDTLQIYNLSWKEMFKDSILQKMIEDGLENNNSIHIAEMKIKEAEALLLHSRLSFLPSVSLSSDIGWNSNNMNNDKLSYKIAGLSEWEIDVFARQRNAKQEAKMKLEQSNAYKQAVQMHFISTIANSYYTMLMLDKHLEIGKKRLLLWDEHLKAVNEMKMAGLTNELDVQLSISNKKSLEASLVSINQNIKEIENSLRTLIGLPGYKVSRSSIDIQSFPSELNTGLPIDLIRNRPDIRQREMELAACFYATNQARSSFYPKIVLKGSAGWSNSLGNVIVNPAEWIFSAVSSLVQPIFNRGENIKNIKIAKAREDVALFTFKQSLLEAGTEVNNALTQYQAAHDRLDIHMSQVESLRKILHDTEFIMKHSSVNYLEILVARQNLLEAELGVVSDRFEKIQATINLYHSVGGGIK